MDSLITISIIVPVYNVEAYLPQCLNSLISQTYQKLEIICVNDGSTDDSLSILRQYAEKDKRIKVVTQINQGLSSARNTGMKYVHGKYLMFIDSDDWIEPETCEVAVNAAEKNNADLVMWSYVREFEYSSKEKLMFWKDGEVFENEAVKNRLHRRLCGLLGEELRHPDYANAIETAWGKLYLAKHLIKNHLKFVDTKEIGTEDALFNLYALGYVQKAIYLRKCFHHYRKTNSISLTSRYKKDLYSCWENLFSYMGKYILENKLSQDYTQALNNRIALSILGLGLNITKAPVSFAEKCKLLKTITSSNRFRNAYAQLDFSYFPFHWKIFYWSAKENLTFITLMLCDVINIIR